MGSAGETEYHWWIQQSSKRFLLGGDARGKETGLFVEHGFHRSRQMFSAPRFSVKSAFFFLLMCSMNKFAYFGPEPLVNFFCYESFSKTSVEGLWKQIQQLLCVWISFSLSVFRYDSCILTLLQCKIIDVLTCHKQCKCSILQFHNYRSICIICNLTNPVLV